MSPAPDSFIAHLCASGYHPRSDKHSNVLAQAIVGDLVKHCPRIRERAAAGELVHDLNFTLRAGTADWNVDLVLGPPQLDTQPPPAGTLIHRQLPSNVQIAVELKAVMTEHRKAVKNRKRDLEAHHEHVHNYNNNAIAGGVLIINGAATFKSPLRPALTTHKSPDKLIAHCVNEFRSVAVRGGQTGYGLEAKCALVVNVDNVNLATACYDTTAPAIPVGDPLHYDSFIRTLCEFYTRRF
ncbi:MAG: hypothetical protein JWN40_2396 [Phycisphaerales bacterium]|nr:hypothetical protein [Phycisphaerales bacterium]